MMTLATRSGAFSCTKWPPPGTRYVVTPNVDHIIRVCDDRVFRNIYEEASYVFLDSQFVAKA